MGSSASRATLPARPAAEDGRAFPCADQIARAIVTACRLTGDLPIATCMRQPSRARAIAMWALMEAYPGARREGIARCCGLAKPGNIYGVVASARRASWWRDDWADEVLGSIVAEQYGEQGQ